MNRRVTGILAWSGLLLILGLPAADMMTRDPEGAVVAGSIARIDDDAPAANDAPDNAEIETAQAGPAQEVYGPSPAPAMRQILPSPIPLPFRTLNEDAEGDEAAGDESVSDAGGGAMAGVTSDDLPLPDAAATPGGSAGKMADEQVADIPQVAPVPRPLSERPLSRPVQNDDSIFEPFGYAERDDRPLEDWETGPIEEFLDRGEQAASANPFYNRSQASVQVRAGGGDFNFDVPDFIEDDPDRTPRGGFFLSDHEDRMGPDFDQYQPPQGRGSRVFLSFGN